MMPHVQPDLERALPSSADAERAVLGAVLLDNGTLAIARESLTPRDFFFLPNRKIFETFLSLAEAQQPIDEIVVSERLESDGHLAEVGGPAYVAALRDGLPRVANVVHHARIVKEKSRLRRLIYLAASVRDKAFAGEVDASAVKELGVLNVGPGESWRAPDLGSLSTAELFTIQESKIEWLAWPFAAPGLATVTDALPKIGKTIFFLQGILAARSNRSFLGIGTKPMRVVYVSEQSAGSLAVQAREVGFTGSEPIEELRWITREYWSRFVFTEFLDRLERQFLDGTYNALIFDTWHTVARLEDENAAAEVNRLGNLTIDVAARNKLALALGRHDRKSGGEVGLSGRSSIQLSGLVDVILHLVRVPGNERQRRLEILGRVPGLPNEQLIELVEGGYINRGLPDAVLDEKKERINRVREWLVQSPHLTADEITARFACLVPPVSVSRATAQRYKIEAKR